MTDYYPPVGFSFTVALAGVPTSEAGFAEVSGLSTEWDIEDVPEGGVPTPHQVPRRVKVGPVVLSRGIMLAPSPFFTWCQSVMEYPLARRISPKDLTVSLLDERGQPLIAWNVVRAWPVRWQVEPFRADVSEVAMERLELACHEVSRRRVSRLARGGMAQHAG